jgi:hypothetical protein
MRVNREIQRQLCDDHENLTAYRRRLEREQRNQRQRNYGGDMVTRCSRCPPASSCDYCAGVNMARIRAGLLRPREDPTPHANNIIPLPLNNGPYRGARPYTDKTAKKHLGAAQGHPRQGCCLGLRHRGSREHPLGAMLCRSVSRSRPAPSSFIKL